MDAPEEEKIPESRPDDALRQLVRSLGADTLRYVPAAVIPAAFSVAGVSVFTRLFNSYEYGRYSLVIATTAILVMLLSGWIGQSILRYLPRFHAEQRPGEFIAKLSVVIAGIVLGVTIIAFVSKAVLPVQMAQYAPFLLPAGLLIVTEILFANYGAVYQAKLMSRDYTVFKVTASVLRFTLALAYVLYIERDIRALIVGAALANLVAVIPMVWRLGLQRQLGRFRESFDAGFVRMLAAYGLPMMGWMMASQILGLSDRYILAGFRGDSDVGIYSANYNLVSMGFGLVSGPILTASYPIVMAAWERGDREAIPALISTFSRYYLVAVVPIVLGLSVFSREIVSIVLGEDFREGYTIIPPVVTGAAAWGLSMIGHKGMEIMEKTPLMLRLVMISAGLNIALNFVFIPMFGYNGAAVTTLFAYLCYPALVWWVGKRHIPWSIPRRTVGNLILSGAVMVSVAFGARAVLAERVPVVVVIIVGGVCGLASYAAMLWLTREFARSN